MQALSVIANDGVKMRPHLVKEVVDVDTKERRLVAKEPMGKVSLAQENLDVIKKALIGVNIEGTSATSFVGATYTSAGKTGTAQVYTVKENEKYNSNKIDERMRDHALYMAYAPADEPKVAIALVVENSGFGAQNAAPIARRIFDYVLLGQYPSQEDIEAVQKGQATRPIGKVRDVSKIAWPPKDESKAVESQDTSLQ